MGDAYPNLKSQQAQIEKVLLKEEQQFARTLDQGLQHLRARMQIAQGEIHSGRNGF